jgi:UDP-N-acetyl-D-galactosamine dehydrogenase
MSSIDKYIIDKTITVVGLGYVGLPLAVEFAKKFKVIGFDINSDRIAELSNGIDNTLEISEESLNSVLKGKGSFADEKVGLQLTSDPNEIAASSIYIITVPTPIDKNKRPVLTLLIKASETVGKVLKQDDIVIYESTVYPGATEDDCVPVLEKYSSLKFNNDFFVGYSPDRINPGDKVHTVTKIRKVTSGSTEEVGRIVDELYQSIILAGTHLASSIKVAEAAKVIENAQRDINIAFVNELAKIFHNMGIDTGEVLEAAGTKWNFLPFKPGLVGGHCIGVDPYYLSQKALETGYNPEIILAGRRMNDGMGGWVASQIVKLLIQTRHMVIDCKVLILGITFKENCPDIRNTKVIDLIDEIKQYGCLVDVHDPWADREEVKDEYDITLQELSLENKYDAIVMAVAHDQFKKLDISKMRNGYNAIIYDIKGIWDKNLVDGRL